MPTRGQHTHKSSIQRQLVILCLSPTPSCPFLFPSPPSLSEPFFLPYSSTSNNNLYYYTQEWMDTHGLCLSNSEKLNSLYLTGLSFIRCFCKWRNFILLDEWMKPQCIAIPCFPLTHLSVGGRLDWCPILVIVSSTSVNKMWTKAQGVLT